MQAAHQQVAEIDTIRREYQYTINVYEDLYNRYRNEIGLHRMYKYVPMRLGDIQQNHKEEPLTVYSWIYVEG